MKKSVSIQALRSNIAKIRGATKAALCAVVKCNAYGHGMSLVSKGIEDIVDCFAVSTAFEAMRLSTSKPILILTPIDCTELVELALQNVILSATSFDDLARYDAFAGSKNIILPVHLKINSGMNRLGFPCTSPHRVLSAIEYFKNLRLDGLFTHFATADGDFEYVYHQYRAFYDFVSAFDTDMLTVHACASSCIWLPQNMHFDMVRVGLAMYGYDLSSTLDLTPAMTVSGEILQITSHQPGDFIGYGKGFLVTRPMTIAVCRGGYGDGLRRGGVTEGWLDGQSCAVLGNICMDMLMLDVTSVSASVGDDVIFLGEKLPATVLAKKQNTIPYEILTSMSQVRER